MVDGDAAALGAAIENGTEMVHMSGRGQSKEDFIREATNGTLNYFHSDIREAHIEVSGDRATLEGTVDLTARVYGMSGTWPVPTHASFHRVSGRWLFSNPAKHAL